MSQVNIENLEVSKTLPAISCDYECLKEWALAYVSRYKDLLVTEDQVKDIKKDMAEINKAKHNLERARIDAVKAVSAPIKEFEAQIKEVCAIFDEAYDRLGKQVKEFEKWERAEKLIDVQNLINDLIQKTILDKPELRNTISIPVNDRWLNKSVKMSVIQEDIELLIEDQIRAEQERKRVEKAQSERRILIENAVKAANEKYGADLPLYPFMEPYYTDLEKNTADIVAIIEKEAQENAESQRERKVFEACREQELACRERDNDSPEVEQGFIEAEFAKPISDNTNNLIMFRLTALFTPEQEDKVREILNQNHFMKIVRQLQGIGADVKFEKVNQNESK